MEGKQVSTNNEENLLMKRIMVLVGMAALMMMVIAPAAFAQSPSQQECEAQGGTFDRTQGTVTCTIVEEEEGKNPRFTETTTTEESSKGTLQNEPQFEEETTVECAGAGTSGNCPPGQFR
jgi:hypothetical protein